MSAMLVVDGRSWGSHKFDHQSPLSAITALRDEAADKVKANRQTLEHAENSVIAAQTNLAANLEVLDRFNIAIDALVDASAEELSK